MVITITLWRECRYSCSFQSIKPLIFNQMLHEHTPQLRREKLCSLLWWRYEMDTFSAFLALCEGNATVTGGSLYKGQWRRALMFSLICAWTDGWANNRDAGNLRRHHAHYDVTVKYYYYYYKPSMAYQLSSSKVEFQLRFRCTWVNFSLLKWAICWQRIKRVKHMCITK